MQNYQIICNIVSYIGKQSCLIVHIIHTDCNICYYYNYFPPYEEKWRKPLNNTTWFQNSSSWKNYVSLFHNICETFRGDFFFISIFYKCHVLWHYENILCWTFFHDRFFYTFATFWYIFMKFWNILWCIFSWWIF